ncbi:MAG: FliH/SctL family protein [bacterium]|nr:FliH/SctL family protein [bacterium]
MQIVRTLEKLKEIPRARTLRRGSYRLLDSPAQAVTVKAVSNVVTELPRLNPTDWFLLCTESEIEKGWENAESAYYQGLDEGFQLGQRPGQIEARKVSAFLTQTLKDLDESILKFYQNLEEETVKLAVSTAEVIVGQAAHDHEDLVKQTIKKVIAEASDKTRIFVKVNPQDFDIMKNARAEIIGLSEGIEHFKIEADKSVTPGSCTVATSSGIIDADFNTQLNELRRTLSQEMEATP